MKQNIIVTGASGVLGNYLVQKFKKNNNIISISKNKNFKSEKMNLSCDLSNNNQVNKIFDLIKKKFKKIDAIVLCAGKSKKNYDKVENLNSWKNSFENNFYSTTNVIDNYLVKYNYSKTKIIVISSIAGLKIIDGAPITYSVAKSALNFYVKFSYGFLG